MILLLALDVDGVTEKRIGSIVKSLEDFAVVMRYDDKVPYNGRMRVHPASLVECFENGVERIEIKVKGDGWIRTTPRNVLVNAEIMRCRDIPIREFYLPLPEWDTVEKLESIYVIRDNAKVVWLEPMDAGEVKARYLQDKTAEQLTLL